MAQERVSISTPGSFNYQGKVVITGAGPAGLSAAYQLVQDGACPVVLEKTDKPGGISRTELYKGFRFDIGGHRFLTHMRSIQQIWEELLGSDLVRTKRRSSIFYGRRVYRYPLDFRDLLSSMNWWEGAQIIVSYAAARVRPFKNDGNLEAWMINRFGERLYNTFFKSYTEKIWGIPCRKIQVEWAHQRIGRLSLRKALLHSLSGKNPVRTQMGQFYYPRLGPGMLWQKIAQQVDAGGGEVRYGNEVVQVYHEGGVVKWVQVRDRDGEIETVAGDQFISTMPLPVLIRSLNPPVEEPIREAADRLAYRDLIIANLIVGRGNLFLDQWLYVHNPKVATGRIQNFGNWSAEMVPDASKSGIGMEYFCSKGDDFWAKKDSQILELAAEELEHLGIAERTEVEDGFVIRQRHAYPVYDASYRSSLKVLCDFLATFKNLQTIGRNGSHRYNNMDHSMMAGIKAAGKILVGEAIQVPDISDEPYIEDAAAEIRDISGDQLLKNTFSKMDKTAFGLATGIVFGGILFMATLWTILLPVETVKAPLNLGLLSHFFYGYSISWKGTIVGGLYGFVVGFLLGWMFAAFRNAMIGLYLYRVTKKVRNIGFREFLELL